MNPATWVAGGGAGGGGSGGKGGKGGDGDAGADGGDGSGEPEGGGKDGNACGNGSNGGCTNCGTKVSRGDPVDVTSGKVFTVPKRELFLPGFFNLELKRSYSSARSKVDLGLGFGWVHSLSWTLEEGRRTLLIRCGDGSHQEMPLLAKVGEQAIFNDWYLSKGENFYVLMPGKEFIHLFSPVEPGSKHYKLDYIIYRNRGKIALQYEKGRLVRAIDTAGRVILFGNTADGRIESISVPDSRGQSIVFARYQYDKVGDLVAATDADGFTTHYAYDQHRLTRLTYPNGVVFHFRYDQSGRCVEPGGSIPTE